MLQHFQVNEAEKEKLESECAHMETAGAFNEIDQHVKALQKDLKRSINKSRSVLYRCLHAVPSLCEFIYPI